MFDLHFALGKLDPSRVCVLVCWVNYLEPFPTPLQQYRVELSLVLVFV